MTTLSAEVTRAEVADAIRQRQRFVVMSHARPDGDAVGSSLAMVAVDWEYLDSLGNAVPGESFRYLMRVDASGPRITTVIATH